MMAGHVRCTLAWALADCGWFEDGRRTCPSFDWQDMFGKIMQTKLQKHLKTSWSNRWKWSNHRVWINFLCETTSRPNHALPLHHDLASMRQAFRVRRRSRCLEAKMWIRGDRWRYAHLVNGKKFSARLNEGLKGSWVTNNPLIRHYFMFGASIGAIVPWQVFITSREFNLNFF